jgi:hypothetical protein
VRLKMRRVSSVLLQTPFFFVFSGFLYPGRDCSLPR